MGERGLEAGFTVGTGKLPQMNPSGTAACALCTCSCPTHPSRRIMLATQHSSPILLQFPDYQFLIEKLPIEECLQTKGSLRSDYATSHNAFEKCRNPTLRKRITHIQDSNIPKQFAPSRSCSCQEGNLQTPKNKRLNHT